MFRMVLAATMYLLVGNALAGVNTCIEDATTACLNGGQFRVTVSHDGNGARFVPPSASPLSGNAARTTLTDETALFSFYGPQQFDLAVKVLDACAVNGRYWVFAALPTDSGIVMTVEDTSTDVTRQYLSTAGAVAAPIADTNAFDCPTKRAEAASGPSTAITGKGSCGYDFCLVGGRFGLDIDFNAFGSSGVGTPIAESADNSALVWLFSPTNLDAIVTMVDGRSDNGAFWFLASAISNVGLTYRLTDTVSGLTNEYVQALGAITTLLDDGAALGTRVTPTGSSVNPGGTARFTVQLTNDTSGSRSFRLVIPTPTDAGNPQFTCQATAPASCPSASGAGPFNETGEIPAGGALSYAYSVTLSTHASGANPLQITATATTLADALSADRSNAVSAQLPIVVAATPAVIPAFGALGLIATMVLLGGIGIAWMSRVR